MKFSFKSLSLLLASANLVASATHTIKLDKKMGEDRQDAVVVHLEQHAQGRGLFKTNSKQDADEERGLRWGGGGGVCGGRNPGRKAPPITTLAASTDFLSTLTAAVTIAGFADALDRATRPWCKRQFTVFAPTDEAFAELEEITDGGDGGLVTLLTTEEEWIYHLRDLLRYHIVFDRVESADLVAAGDGAMVTTIEGSDLEFDIDSVSIVDATGEGAAIDLDAVDIAAKNGVVHVIDKVLVPPFLTYSIAELGASLDDFSTLITAVNIAGLFDTLDNDGPFTLFAPTNDAFAKIDPDTLADILADTELLTSILLFHVSPGIIASPDLPSDGIPTVNGEEIPVSTRHGRIFLNGNAQFESVDTLTNNGIVHVIDTVLVPP